MCHNECRLVQYEMTIDLSDESIEFKDIPMPASVFPFLRDYSTFFCFNTILDNKTRHEYYFTAYTIYLIVISWICLLQYLMYLPLLKKKIGFHAWLFKIQYYVSMY